MTTGNISSHADFEAHASRRYEELQLFVVESLQDRLPITAMFSSLIGLDY